MADDEMSENQDFAPEGDEAEEGSKTNPKGGLEESLKSRLTGLESLIAQKDEALASAEVRITELEQALAESQEKIEVTSNSLAEAVASYRNMVSKANPEIPEELVSGDSIEALNQSLEEAKGLISHVKQGLEAEIQATRVPAGAPQRTPPDLSALSPREKIQYGVRR